MKRIKKLYDVLCGEVKYIGKNSGGKRYCRQCWSAHSVTTTPQPTVRRKRLPPRSPKRIKEDAVYSVERRIFLDEHPVCEAHLPGICTHVATEVHHKEGRTGDNYLDKTKWLGACHQCHCWITDHTKEALEAGLSLKRIK